MPWESFRAEIEAVVLTPDELKKSSAGRKPFDAILMCQPHPHAARNWDRGEPFQRHQAANVVG